MAISSIKTLIPGEIHKVWELVLDIDNYGVWRSDLSRAVKPFVKSYLKKQQAQFVADIRKALGGI